MTSVDIAIPVYNEQMQLEESITKLSAVVADKRFEKYKINIIIVNNASTDSTPRIAKQLAARFKNVKFLTIPLKGRGRALTNCWRQSKADIVAYMDTDLSADLSFLKVLLDAVAVDKADIAIGSRLSEGSKVYGRTLTRELMSRGYNLIIRIFFKVSFRDAQCGFKAISLDAFRQLDPAIKNQNWFFDSEMLIIAMKAGFTIKEIPISWRDNPGSTVKVAKTAKEDLLGLLRLARTKPWESISKN
jgi:glycosyltransferase involved in cell wall biosynthesis